jgi:hypothetical protein
MSRTFKRRLRHAASDSLPEPEPDRSGWSGMERLLWAARNGKFEELVGKARQENEAKLRAEGKPPVPEPVAELKPLPVELRPVEPPPVEPPPAPPSPAEPQPERLWWQERARWRARGAADYDWGDGPRYECLHEYDPLAEEDEDEE